MIESTWTEAGAALNEQPAKPNQTEPNWTEPNLTSQQVVQSELCHL